MFYLPNKRDDFTEATKRKAASRAGYRCSFPGCLNSTVGASMEKYDGVSVTGVGAHICAAAPGGKRYDDKMTAEERRSIDNCIWMCQTHARLIDTDEITYTVEKLKQWKSDAEVKSSQQLASISFFDDYYSASKTNPSGI